MAETTFIEVENSVTKELEIFAIITNDDGSYISMPKAVWDELEAAKENGTISQKNELETI